MKTGKLGLEMEYMILDNNLNLINDSEYQEYLIEKYGLAREYYAFMVEFNELLYSYNINEIYDILSNFKNKIIEKANKISKNEKIIIAISEFPLIKYNGLVFNGFHIHLSTKAISDFQMWRILYLSIDFKLKHVDLRFLTSHHLWGALRSSEYSFKNNSRYKLINITNIPTLEFRLFSFWDIYFDDTRYQLAKLFINIVNYLTKKKKLLFKREKYHQLRREYEKLREYECEDYKMLINDYKNLLQKSKLYKFKDNKLYFKTLISRNGKLDILESYIEID